MARLYKLTDEHMRTYGETQWELNKPMFANGLGTKLCTAGVLHAYSNQLLAVLLNPIHANFKRPRMFLCEGDVVATDGLKIGSKRQTLIAEIDLPKPSIECHIAFGILYAIQSYKEPEWFLWALNWLDGTDRSAAHAAKAANTAHAALAAHAAADAAHAAYAANAAKAAHAADAAHAAYAADAALLEQLAELAFVIASDGI